MIEKRDWAARHADHLRRALVLEPRGHADMTGAVLTEPVSPGTDAGVLFFHNDGYSTMCGHGILAVSTIALERGLLLPGGDAGTIVYDTPAGTIRARAIFVAGRAGQAGGAGRAGRAGRENHLLLKQDGTGTAKAARPSRLACPVIAAPASAP